MKLLFKIYPLFTVLGLIMMFVSMFSEHEPWLLIFFFIGFGLMLLAANLYELSGYSKRDDEFILASQRRITELEKEIDAIKLKTKLLKK